MAKAEIWGERVGEWRKSGLSAVKFADGREFSSHQLSYWGAKIRRAEKARQEGATPGPVGADDVRLARVVRVSAAGTGSTLAVEMHGARVVVPRGFDRPTFCAVLDELEARVARGSRR